MPKGENIDTPDSSAALQELEPESVIVLDQVLLHMAAQAVQHPRIIGNVPTVHKWPSVLQPELQGAVHPARACAAAA